MQAILRHGNSFRAARCLHGRPIEPHQPVTLDTVADYIYLLEAHGDKFQLRPPALYRRLRKHGQEQTVQTWEVRRYLREGWRPLRPALLRDADKLLVIRNMGLGDVLMVTPTLRALIAAGKHVEFATLARYVPLLYGLAGLQACHALGTDYLADRFAAWLDFNWLAETSKLAGECPRHEIFARAAGVRLASPLPHYLVAEQERRWARRLLGERPSIAVQLRASCPLRTYPRSHLRIVVDQLLHSGFEVLLLGDRRETSIGRIGVSPVGRSGDGPLAARNLTGSLGIRATAALIEQCACLIAPDSGLLHLAAALATPAVGIFGPIDPALRVAGYPLCRTISGNREVGCQPCNDRPVCLKGGSGDSSERVVAGREHPRCLRAIAPEAVVELALQQCRG